MSLFNKNSHAGLVQHILVPEILADTDVVVVEKLFKISCSKADYGHDAGRRKYPTYGDYYRTHRYPLNDGWMLWDEDLRDLDSKSNKIGFGKDGGR